MKALFSLSFVKKKAKIRSILSKPLSAILTLVVVAGYIWSLSKMFTVTGSDIMDRDAMMIYTITNAMIMLIFVVIMLVQKKMSLFFVEDSYYMFIGPFSNRQILTYLILEDILPAIMMGMVTSFFTTIAMASMYQIPPVLFVLATLSVSIVMYFVTVMIDFFYLKKLITKRTSKAQIGILAILLLVLAGMMVWSIYQSGWDLRAGFMNFFIGDMFDWIPIFGWSRWALSAYVVGNTWLSVAIYAGLVACCIGLALIVINTKGYFYEQAIIDAEEFTKYYRAAMAGNTESVNQKVHESKVSFAEGAQALFSKNLLVAKKTRSIISMNEFAGIASMVGVMMFSGAPFILIMGMLVMYLSFIVSSESIKTDFKSPYTYLIPEKPLKKLMASIALPMLKTLIMATIAVVVPAIYLSVPLIQMGIALIVVFAVVMCVYASNVLAIRMLKTRTTMMIESAVRMASIMAMIAPAALGVWLAYLAGVDLTVLIYAGSILGSCLAVVVALIVFKMCSPMMNGTEY
ncbi:hypothetical protein G7062_09435 [Erysipelothrix sp. HDW6C]|uniref:putative ABC exporter domain-containing protein n=1 Tax=Erysipelothrix sp. HDW6C TaxID=2714930 RepID=UPI00140E48AC|nr:putative ABC exporter domain-containing protein [Erysipelothrix sp. HDW6C]QIK70511.1 hypothetical protein G7062_09435 [Erysipelothrix sp. HDW6C]